MIITIICCACTGFAGVAALYAVKAVYAVKDVKSKCMFNNAWWKENNVDLNHIRNILIDLEQWDVDTHEKLCEIGSMLKAQQNWNEKIGSFMADLGAAVYEIKKAQKAKDSGKR